MGARTSYPRLQSRCLCLLPLPVLCNEQLWSSDHTHCPRGYWSPSGLQVGNDRPSSPWILPLSSSRVTGSSHPCLLHLSHPQISFTNKGSSNLRWCDSTHPCSLCSSAGLMSSQHQPGPVYEPEILTQAGCQNVTIGNLASSGEQVTSASSSLRPALPSPWCSVICWTQKLSDYNYCLCE